MSPRVGDPAYRAVTFDQVRDAYREQVRGLLDGGSDLLLAETVFDPEQVRRDLLATRKACEKHGCPLEFILKDISTVRYEPERLARWAVVAMEVAGA